MPMSVIDANGAIFTPGLDPQPHICPVDCTLQRGYSVTGGNMVVRDCDGLEILSAFKIRARLRSSKGGEAILIAFAGIGPRVHQSWLPGGIALSPNARELREFARWLRRGGCEVGTTPAAHLLAQRLVLRALHRFGPPKTMTVREATRFFDGLPENLQGPRARVLEACVDVGVVAGEGR